VRFHRYLSFHLDFQLQKLVLALKIEVFEEELEIICSKDCWNDIALHVEVRGGACVTDCDVCLTMLAVVVVEKWGEISHHFKIWWRSQWGEWYGVPGSDGIAM
jgi:hypothetical protein